MIKFNAGIRSLGLKKKLVLLLITALVTPVLIGFLTQVVINSLSGSNALNTFTLTLENDFEKIRNHEKDFLFQDINDAKFYQTNTSENVENVITGITELENKVEALRMEQSALKNEMDQTLKQLKIYRDSFLEIRQVFLSKGFKDYGTVGKMRNAIHEIENFLNQRSGFQTFEVHMLMLRRHEKDYLLRKDLNYFTKFSEEYHRFLETIQLSRLPAVQKDQLGNQLSVYRSYFEDVIEKDKQLGYHSENQRLLGSLQQAALTIAPSLERVRLILQADSQQRSNSLKTWMAGIFIGGLFLCTMLFVIINRDIYKSIGGDPSEVAEAMNKISNGELNLQLNTTKVYGLYDTMRRMIHRLNEIVRDVNLIAKDISLSGNEMSEVCKSIHEGSQNQLVHSKEMTNYVNEMATTIQKNVERIERSEAVAVKLLDEIRSGVSSVTDTEQAMKNITDQISIIHEIAQETNILSINASVEAARARENGKGFSTIASEVRKLAENSSEAAKEISEISKSGISVAERTQSLFEQLSKQVSSTVDIVHEVGSAIKEQNERAVKINNSIEQVNQVIKENSLSLDKIVTIGNRLNLHASKLNQTIEFFQTKP